MSHDGGRSWEDVTPRPISSDRFVEDIDFLNPETGWIVAAAHYPLRSALFRTSDGGRSWDRKLIGSVGEHGGASVEVDFVDALHGWLVNQDPTGPVATLSRTSDGGETWSKNILHRFPQVSRVMFTDTTHGWGNDAVIESFISETRDGGAHWRMRSIKAPQGFETRGFDLPTFFGSQGVLPLSLVNRHESKFAFYITSDGGRSWIKRSVLHSAHRRGSFLRASSIVSPSVWWAIDGSPPHVYRTTDGGMSWMGSPLKLPGVQNISSIYYPVITAVSSTIAWLNTTTARDDHQTLYATTDGGRTWRKLTPPR